MFLWEKIFKAMPLFFAAEVCNGERTLPLKQKGHPFRDGKKCPSVTQN